MQNNHPSAQCNNFETLNAQITFTIIGFQSYLYEDSLFILKVYTIKKRFPGGILSFGESLTSIH